MDRSESDQGESPPQSTPGSGIIRTPGLWFDDATNVIQAGNHQFRVHQSILSARSPVLSSLFSVPIPDGIQRVDGCPVVNLPDDAEDVKNLLFAIYDPSFFEPPPKEVPVEVVLSVARLSQKYGIQHLRRRAILHMERNYPSDMDAYLSRRTDHPISGQSSWFDHLETSLDIINTATTINAPWVLPAMYYHCAHTTLSNEFRATPSWNYPQKIAILRDILTGKINLEVMDVAFDELLGTPPSSGCLSRERCALRKLSTASGLPSLLTSAGEPPGRKCHTLGLWWNREWLKEDHLRGLCPPCASACLSAYDSARGDYWDNIPAAFDLPSWTELKSLKEADLDD